MILIRDVLIGFMIRLFEMLLHHTKLRQLYFFRFFRLLRLGARILHFFIHGRGSFLYRWCSFQLIFWLFSQGCFLLLKFLNILCSNRDIFGKVISVSHVYIWKHIIYLRKLFLLLKTATHNVPALILNHIHALQVAHLAHTLHLLVNDQVIIGP